MLINSSNDKSFFFSSKRKMLTGALLGVLVIILAACGGDSEEESNSTKTSTTNTANEQAAAPVAPVSKSIVDIAVEDGRFTTLVTALQAAELDTVLAGEGPFTVFAPTDDAFGKLPEGTVEGLLADIPGLTDVLLYHVVSGNVQAKDVLNLDSADTLQGSSFAISVMDGKVMVNESEVIITDIEAVNGTIHVIDTVLLPTATS